MKLLLFFIFMRHKKQIIYDEMVSINPFGQIDWYLHFLTISIIKCEKMKHSNLLISNSFTPNFEKKTECLYEKQIGYL